jgi:hypothetical protein
MLESADALDAVIASFAAIAIAKNAVPGYASYEDGFIAVAE